MSASSPTTRIFGIRHHGPGSARSLVRALEAMQPDAVLVEGPREAEPLLPLITFQDMRPPVALLVYVPDEPMRSTFYPFAVFSPEWQALHYGVSRGLAVRFIDLPQAYWLAMRETRPRAAEVESMPEDPLDRLARAAGFEDGDRWWEQLVEERVSDEGVFDAVLELMAALRAEIEAGPEADQYQSWVDPLGPVREAAMRAGIREAREDGFERIAVVCGAMHAPALLEADQGAVDEDLCLLEGLPRVEVTATWVPWSYAHLSRTSGYGAGITSPGWYEHLWTVREQATTRWLGRVARLLREEDLDASAAQVIDAVRLADALAAMRHRARPGLRELNQAALTVFCFGNPLPLVVIHDEMVVGERLGQVPSDAPIVPLQRDLAATQRRLRLKPRATTRQLDLDLRKPNGLARSHLLHRLDLLGIPWGRLDRVRGKLGTFHELWTVKWEPAFAVALIDRAVWGNTIAAAATAYARHLTGEASGLPAVTALLEKVLLADLPEALGAVVDCLQAHTARTGDVGGLMEALPPLARTVRYGTVRQDAQTADLEVGRVSAVVEGVVTRVCLGLPLACGSLDDAAARRMVERIEAVHASLGTMGRPDLMDRWQETLEKLADQRRLHGLVAGRCCRLLYEGGLFDTQEIARRLRLALSLANDPAQAAAWLEGVLRGSGLLLLHDERLWTILDEWVVALQAGAFKAVVPLLRRTFSVFPAPERRQMGERVRRGRGRAGDEDVLGVDVERAGAVLPLMAQLLGLDELETGTAGHRGKEETSD